MSVVFFLSFFLHSVFYSINAFVLCFCFCFVYCLCILFCIICFAFPSFFLSSCLFALLLLFPTVYLSSLYLYFMFAHIHCTLCFQCGMCFSFLLLLYTARKKICYTTFGILYGFPFWVINYLLFLPLPPTLWQHKARAAKLTIELLISSVFRAYCCHG